MVSDPVELCTRRDCVGELHSVWEDVNLEEELYSQVETRSIIPLSLFSNFLTSYKYVFITDSETAVSL